MDTASAMPDIVKRQADIFSKRGALIDISLSPEGTHFAGVFQNGSDQYLKITEIQTGKTTKEIDFDYNWRFGRLIWANNERLLVQPAYKPSATNVVFQTNAIYAVNVNGKKERFLLGPGSGARLGSKANRGSDGMGASVLSTLPNNPRNVLVQVWESGAKTASTAKLDIYTGKLSDRIFGPDAIFYCQFAINLADEPEFCVTEDRTSDLGQIYHRDNNENWNLVYQAKAWDEEQNVYSQLLDGGFLGTFHHPESSKRSYYELAVNESELERKLIMTDGARDLGGLTYSRQFDFGRISMRNPYPAYAYLGTNDVLNDVHKALVVAFPRSYVDFRSITNDGKLALVRVSNEIKPSEYFLIDTASLKLQRIANSHEHLLDETSVVEGFELAARDGSRLFGFVTKANPDVPQRGAVLMVHGGPHGSFDRFGYDADAQFMASLG